MTEQEIHCRIIASKFLHPDFVEEKDPSMLDGTFKQLWNYCGLQDLGIDYMHQGSFNQRDKQMVINEWLKVFYNASDDSIQELRELAIARRVRVRAEFLEKSPNGHITLLPFSDTFNSMIDNVFGNYR